MGASRAQVDGDILYNVARVEIEELDSVTGLVKAGVDKIIVTCDSTVEIEPVISEGKSDTLRDGNKVLANVEEDDLLVGYNLKLTNTRFPVAFAAMVEGGTVRYSAEAGHEDEIIGYDSPKLADGNTKIKPFKLTVYVKNYEGDDVLNYVKVTFNKCKGKAPKISFKKEFYAPEFEIKARENTKADLTMKSIDYVDTLPVS